MATNSPFCLAPIRTLERLAEAGPDALNTSSRLITILTGRPDFFDKIMATGSR